jgi:hypothetical protein
MVIELDLEPGFFVVAQGIGNIKRRELDVRHEGQPYRDLLRFIVGTPVVIASTRDQERRKHDEER